MQIANKDKFVKKQYKKLDSSFRSSDIKGMSEAYMNLAFMYGLKAESIARYVVSVANWKQDRRIWSDSPSTPYMSFAMASIAKNPFVLFKKIQEIRKQEEAPEVKTEGAESSQGKPSDYGDCDWCFSGGLVNSGGKCVGGDFICDDCHSEYEALKVKDAESSGAMG
ncbi:hypothetical protein ATY36_11745 [Vibrio cidicii]|uniref:hypothetical protein n=1 Tax=Vibrio cidicii TaxID=1763883 RepID=UPI00078002A8|nr:hypothetical protein [Vibrio cidicii]KYN83510.1 hypothetical protein ATY36_11745 [Vibrio cidicii]